MEFKEIRENKKCVMHWKPMKEMISRKENGFIVSNASERRSKRTEKSILLRDTESLVTFEEGCPG